MHISPFENEISTEIIEKKIVFIIHRCMQLLIRSGLLCVRIRREMYARYIFSHDMLHKYFDRSCREVLYK